MERKTPRHYLAMRNTERQEVRHLVILFLDGSADTQLVQFTNGTETILGRGTEYETRLQADTFAKAWVEDEQFEQLPNGNFAFEPLSHVVALAQRLGFVVVYDPRFKNTEFRSRNFTGAVSLSDWPGLTPKNGGTYLYAIDQMRLHARPQLSSKGSRLIAPTDSHELVAFIKKHGAALDAIGPSVTFLLARMTPSNSN